MTGKLKMLIGLGVGYVLGARAGRGRYEQIANQAQRFMHDPRVQDKAGQAKDFAAEKAAGARDTAAEKAGEAVDAAKEKVQEKRGGDTPTTGLGAGMPGTDKETTEDLGALGTAPVTPNDTAR
ncbi:uncharacterized protein YjbJ (UPF0337 family) [Nocardioides daedukensis]|uniref:Uncharacterized protein YjbJ (UPF0337 family) n=1 Tax=Nocardioides daedukensis TaxID=634462 RepID=A0A7Y9RXI2_9ACTN|nr:YtxH domain-containing protein [Nocardioides daedukensis]NYG57226.1 uncharacterized protein YjbJ (UPF0337 family) [Nocardioides daedukensis]